MITIARSTDLGLNSHPRPERCCVLGYGALHCYNDYLCFSAWWLTGFELSNKQQIVVSW